MANLNDDSIKNLLETMTQEGIVRAEGKKLLVSASLWKYMNGISKDPVPTPPTYEVEVNFDEVDK